MGANHPDNPFGVPVRVDALFAGLPSRRQRFTTDSMRAVAEIAGPLGDCDYAFSIVHSDEGAQARMHNMPDDAAIMSGPQGDDAKNTLSFYSAVQPPTEIPSGLFVETQTERYDSSATQLQAAIQGSLITLPAGRLVTHVGAERRQERINFDTRIRGAGRDITSTFAHVRLPLIDPTMEVWVAHVKVLLVPEWIITVISEPSPRSSWACCGA